MRRQYGVEHVVDGEQTATSAYPFGGHYRTESESVSACGAVFEGYGVDRRIPADGMYARHFGAAYVVYAHGCAAVGGVFGPTVDSRACSGEFFGQCYGCTARMVEFMRVVYLGHVRGVLREWFHERGRVSVYQPEQSHTKAVVGAPHECSACRFCGFAHSTYCFSPSGCAAYYGHAFADSGPAQSLGCCRSGEFYGCVGRSESLSGYVGGVFGIDYRYYLVSAATGYALNGVSHLSVTYYGYFHYVFG